MPLTTEKLLQRSSFGDLLSAAFAAVPSIKELLVCLPLADLHLPQLAPSQLIVPKEFVPRSMVRS